MPSPSGATGPFAQVRELTRAVALYVEARGRLLQIEAREAGSRSASILILAALGVAFVFFAWLLAMPALVWLIALKVDWHWSRVALVGAGGHLLLGLLLLTVLRARVRGWRPFEASLKELEKDRAYLNPPADS